MKKWKQIGLTGTNNKKEFQRLIFRSTQQQKIVGLDQK